MKYNALDERRQIMKITTKAISIICIIALMAGLMSGCVKDNRAVITVNGEVINQSGFGYYFSMVKQQMLSEAGISTEEDAEKFWKTPIDGEDPVETAREKAKDEIINMTVRSQEAKKAGIELTHEELQQITASINDIISNVGGKDEYEKQLKDMGTDASSYEDLYKKVTLISKYEQSLESDGTLTVSEDEVKDYIEENYIKAKHILFATQDLTTGEPYDQARVDSVKQTALNVLERIKDGGDFDKLMNEYSEDTGLSENPDGYEFTKGEMVQQFEDAAFELEDGEVSDLVETGYGIHIIKRVPFVITDEKVSEYTANAETMILAEKFDEFTEELVDKAKIKVNERLIKKFK